MPTAIARCANETHVVTCVQWRLENGVAPVVRGGGHSDAGHSAITGLFVDLREMNTVTLVKVKTDYEPQNLHLSAQSIPISRTS